MTALCHIWYMALYQTVYVSVHAGKSDRTRRTVHSMDYVVDVDKYWQWQRHFIVTSATVHTDTLPHTHIRTHIHTHTHTHHDRFIAISAPLYA